jgi:hypothetical protein
MSVHRSLALAVVALLVVVPSSSAQPHQCSQTEARRAEAQADTLRSWDALYRSYRIYRQCDDGAIGEGYSESVARILVDRWVTLPRLAQLARKDKEFQRFVLKHVDETINQDDARRIEANAQHECPTPLLHLCGDLIQQAKPH